MGITRKATLLAIALATACVVALIGCGGTSASSSSTMSSNASSSTSAAPDQQADKQAQPYVGTWKADKLTLLLKTQADNGEVEVDVPVVVELHDNMTGKLVIGSSEQGLEWEVRTWENLKLERAVLAIHETFELKGIMFDPEHLLVEFTDSKESLHFFGDWTSSAQPGVKLGIDTTLEKSA